MARDDNNQQILAVGESLPKTGMWINANPIQAFGNRSAAKCRTSPQVKAAQMHGTAQRLLLFKAQTVARSASQGAWVKIDR